jgi:hypothetical protein
MAELVKILTTEVAVNATPSNITLASLVRIINTSNSTNALITQRDSSNNVLGTLTLPFAGGDESVIYLMKEPTDTVESNSSVVFGTSVGFY